MSANIATAGAAFFSGSGTAEATVTADDIRTAISHLKGANTDEANRLPQLNNFVNGKWVQSSSGNTLSVVDPATGQISCYVGRSNAEDVDVAVRAAHAARVEWANTSTQKRAELLEKVATTLRARAEQLALCESCDVGKPVRLARMIDIPRAAENFDFFARMIRTDSTASHAMPDAVNFTQRCPVGVAALVTPWNLPLYLLTWKVAPALACGNCVVVKASELTPLTATALAEILTDCGLPQGVFNLVHGLGAEAGAALVSHDLVRLVSFTGGTATGRLVATATASTFKKTSLELGGKNPAIVFADCNIDAAVEGVARGCFLNSGQVCL